MQGGIEVEAADHLLLMAECISLVGGAVVKGAVTGYSVAGDAVVGDEETPACKAGDEATAYYIKVEVGAVIKPCLITRVALIEQLTIAFVQRHLVLTDIKDVAQSDETPYECKVELCSVTEILLSVAAVALERAEIGGLQSETVERSKAGEVGAHNRIEHYVVAYTP